jgi:hypothetical protein
MNFNHPSQVYRDCVLSCALTCISFLIDDVKWIIEYDKKEYTLFQNYSLIPLCDAEGVCEVLLEKT